MKKLLTNNLGLKLLSIVAAAMLWLVVLYIEDPVMYADFSPIQVTILNENVITDQGKVYQIEDNSDVISVRVRAHRSVLEKLSTDDFTATADMEKNLKYGNLVGIEVTCRNTKIESTNITKSRENVVLNVEDASTEQFNVVVVEESSPPDGYMVGTTVPEQSMIEISGPSSVVSKIRRVEAVLNASGLTTDGTVHCELRVVDGNNDIISGTDLATLEFTGKTEGINVSVTMLRTKTVPLRVEYSGTPDAGYSFSSISYKPENIEIAGTAESIADVTEIVIPGEAVNIDGITENLQTTVDITPYLPEGIRLKDSTEASIAVVVEIERKQGMTVEIPVSDIGLQNVPRGYEVDFGDLESVELIVMGTSEDLNNLNIDEIAVSLDLDQYSRAGTYTATLQVTLPDDVYSLMEDVQVDFELVRGTGNSNTNNSTNEDTAGGSTGGQTDTSGSASDEEEEETGTGSGTGTGTGGSSSGSESSGSGTGGNSSSDSTEGGSSSGGTGGRTSSGSGSSGNTASGEAR